MRQGYNPHKDQEQEQTKFTHQIVLPVFIPNEEGYYKDAFRILQLCIQSLLLTIHDQTFVTIINNGSCLKIARYLDDLFSESKIHELIHTENIGKLNSVLKGLTGNSIALVTIADSDVMFCSGWQQATLDVFNNFPKAGVVGLTPQFKMFENGCGNVLFDTLFSDSVRFSEVVDPNSLERFYESIGWDKNYNHDYLKQNLSITKKKGSALIGSGHFVATYRKSIFAEITTYIGYKMGGNSEGYLDEAPLKKGFWRLTTNANYAFHMGNVMEEWMNIFVKELPQNENADNITPLLPIKLPRVSKTSYFIKIRLFSKLFSIRLLRKWYFRFKKLPSSMIEKY